MLKDRQRKDRDQTRNETSLKLILSKQDKRNLLNLEKILPIIVPK